MTEEEYNAHIEEQNRLVDQINRLQDELQDEINRYNQLVAEYNMVVQELNFCVQSTAELANRAVTMGKAVIPDVKQSEVDVTEVEKIVRRVIVEIDELADQYFTIKNISTATKNMTKLNDQYRRDFGFYETLRRVTLGYVIGVDSHVVNSEKLRKTVEKNYLMNADYWVAHCIMAVMLWVSNEKEAAERAVKKAMETASAKATLFFLLIDLRFGRYDAAKQWMSLYLDSVNISDVGDEFVALLQVYLYDICGNDPEFNDSIRSYFQYMLDEVIARSPGYNDRAEERIYTHIDGQVLKTDFDSKIMRRTLLDYKNIIEITQDAEKNAFFANYYKGLSAMEEKVPEELSAQIENVLYDLINTLDDGEKKNLRESDYNNMILLAKGDVAAARKMYMAKYGTESRVTLSDLLISFVIPTSETDSRVKKFATSYLYERLANAFEKFRNDYRAKDKKAHRANIEGLEVDIDETDHKKSYLQVEDYYTNHQKELLNKNKDYRGLRTAMSLCWVGFILLLAFTAGLYTKYISLELNPLIAGGVTLAMMLFAIIFTVSFGKKKKKLIKSFIKKKKESLAMLDELYTDLAAWRERYNVSDAQYAELESALAVFKQEKENTVNEQFRNSN